MSKCFEKDQKQPIEYFKKKAKFLHRRMKNGDSLALARASAIFRDTSRLSLTKAQHIVAVEEGFLKWEELRKAVIPAS